MAKRSTGTLPASLLAVLGFLAATSAVATDLYLASTPDIAFALDASASSVQLTLSLFFFGVGAGQLLLGPISDMIGRRPVLITSLLVFSLAGIATTFVQSIEALIILRLVQGLSGAAGIVLSRAIAADLSSGETAVRALSLIAMVVGLGPLLAPPLGGAVHAFLGWRGVLGALAVISITMLVAAWIRIPESLPREQRLPHGLAATFRPFGVLVRDRVFVSIVLAYALGFSAMIAYISASPFVGQRVLGMSAFTYALAFAAGASALLGANLVNARLAPRVGPRRMLLVGVGASLIGGGAMFALVMTGTLTIASFIACAFVLTAGAGLTQANASALALARAGAARGSGSALLGAAQFALGGAIAPLVGAWGSQTAVPMAVIVLLAAAGSALFSVLSLRFSRR